jgi:hypothetical protein
MASDPINTVSPQGFWHSTKIKPGGIDQKINLFPFLPMISSSGNDQETNRK